MSPNTTLSYYSGMYSWVVLGLLRLALFFRKTLLFQNFVVMQLNFKAQYGVPNTTEKSSNSKAQNAPPKCPPL